MCRREKLPTPVGTRLHLCAMHASAENRLPAVDTCSVSGVGTMTPRRMSAGVRTAGGGAGSDALNIFDKCAQQLGHAPRLRDRATRGMRRIAVEDFRDVPQTCFFQMNKERVKESSRVRDRRGRAPVHLEIG